jgi:hypothetical protein
LTGDGNLLRDISTVAVGIGGLAIGIITYYWAQVSRRKEALFPLMEQFDSSEGMSIAKTILDDFIITSQPEWKNTINEFSFIWDEILKSGPRSRLDFLNSKFTLPWLTNGKVIGVGNDLTIINGNNRLTITSNIPQSSGIIDINGIIIEGLVVREEQPLVIGMDHYYQRVNLGVILRNHEVVPIMDDGEIAIRKSFDALLDFFV